MYLELYAVVSLSTLTSSTCMYVVESVCAPPYNLQRYFLLCKYIIIMCGSNINIHNIGQSSYSSPTLTTSAISSPIVGIKTSSVNNKVEITPVCDGCTL